MAKKKTKQMKLEELEFMDGKNHDESNHQLAKDIEDLLMPDTNPFGTNSMEDLESMLEGMNLRQVQEVAVKASVFPSGNKTSLKNKIKKEFKMKYLTKDGGRRNYATSESPVVKDKILAEEISNILNGR
jgi:hypothetical protein